MLEFVFFDDRPRRGFVEFLAQRQVPYVLETAEDSLLVAIPEDVDDALMAAVEARYDEMMTLDQSLFETASDDPGHQAAGVVLNLATGEARYARVDPVLLGKIMAVLTPEELGDLVNAIVDAVENPDLRPLCKPPEA